MFMPRTIANAVDKIARQSVGKDWSLYAALLERWQEIVGSDYARDTTPSKIAFPYQPTQQRRSNGTLTVRLPKGLAMEFSFKAEQIKQRINSYFGYDAVGKISFEPVYGAPAPKTAPAELPPEKIAELKEQSKAVESAELQEALQAFGEAVAKTAR